jgi:hypothetical protein
MRCQLGVAYHCPRCSYENLDVFNDKLTRKIPLPERLVCTGCKRKGDFFTWKHIVTMVSISCCHCDKWSTILPDFLAQNMDEIESINLIETIFCTECGQTIKLR